MRVLDDVFQMGSGYVLDFSDRTMAEFFEDELGIDIDHDRYRQDGNSKAKRLRSFLTMEDDATAARVMRALWDYRDAINGPFNGSDPAVARTKEQFFAILLRLESSSDIPRTDPIERFAPDETLDQLVQAIERDIQANSPQAALDRLHTYCMKKFGHVLTRKGIPFEKDDPLNSRAGKYVKALQQERDLRDMTVRILKMSISVFDAFNNVRNTKSLAHDNELVDRQEARFIFDGVVAILRFMKAVEMSRFGA
jgi:hypothetical protein